MKKVKLLKNNLTLRYVTLNPFDVIEIYNLWNEFIEY